MSTRHPRTNHPAAPMTLTLSHLFSGAGAGAGAGAGGCAPGASVEPGIEPLSGWAMLRAARDGDRDAFAEFYRRYRPIVASYLRNRGVDHDAVEDLTQEVFLRAWRYLDTVTEQRDDPAAWLFTIARDQATDRARSAAYRLTEPVAEIPEPRRDDTARVAPSAETLALAEIARAETTAQVRSAIAGLNPVHQQAVAAFLAERSHDEEAIRIGITRGATKARRSRALRAAHTALTRAGADRTFGDAA